MTSKVRSTKEAQTRLSQQLRAEGKTWVEVANIFRTEYRVNARVAFRAAHGWSQKDAADRWNERWPTDPKTFKNFSYWEQWPNRTGYTPSLDVLSRLADLYECAVADLLVDCPSFRHCDPMYRSRAELHRLSVALGTFGPGGNDLFPVDNGSKATNDDLAGFVKQLRDSDAEELAAVADRKSVV